MIRHFIGGERVDSSRSLPLHGSYSGELIDQVAQAGEVEVSSALDAASGARQAMRRLSPLSRARALENFASTIRDDRDLLARLIAEDMGKAISEACFEVSRCAEVAELTAAALLTTGDFVPPLGASEGGADRWGVERRVPAGVVVAIAPFNAPLNLGMSKAIAALGAGCSVVVKTPPQAPRVIDRVADLSHAAGLPNGAFNVLHGGAETGRLLVESEIPRVISFTGSVGAGRAISHAAGLKRLVLELGSNAPTIVCADADLDVAAAALLRGAYGSAGQACISTQRILVHTSVVERFVEQFVPMVDRLVVGDPLSSSTDLGPVVDDAAADRVRSWVNEACDQGATVLTSRQVPERGRLLPPILLSEVTARMRLWTEEVFGPVALLIPFEDDEQAAHIANDTPYGLQAGVFTRSIDRAFDYADRLDFGGVQINDSSRVRLDAHAFGGMKESGIGREGIIHALESMTERQFVGLRRHPASPHQTSGHRATTL